MTLAEYIEQGSDTLTGLSLKSGVSYQTLKAAARGMKLKLYDKAKAISDATNPRPNDPKSKPAVSISELCE